MQCLILAGGFGRRLQPLIGERPKALLEHMGKPLISHIIDRVPSGIGILVSTNKRFETEFFNWQKSVTRPVEILIEQALNEEQKLGSLSAVNYWSRRLNIQDDLMVIAADNYFEFELSKLITAYNGLHAIVAAYDLGDEQKARDFGVIRLDGRKIVEFIEKPVRPVSTLVATACYIFPPRILNTCAHYCLQGKRDRLGDFIAYLVNTDEVHGFTFAERWFDIGTEIRMS